MRMMNVVGEATFRERGAHAEPLLIDEYSRILRFALSPGQTIREHNNPGKPVYIVVLQGHGVFTDGTGAEVEVGPDALLVYEPGEKHSVRAKDEPLVFLAILPSASHATSGREGGLFAR